MIFSYTLITQVCKNVPSVISTKTGNKNFETVQTKVFFYKTACSRLVVNFFVLTAPSFVYILQNLESQAITSCLNLVKSLLQDVLYKKHASILLNYFSASLQILGVKNDKSGATGAANHVAACVKNGKERKIV